MLGSNFAAFTINIFYDIRHDTTNPLDGTKVARSLPGASARPCLGNLVLPWRAVSGRILDRGGLSNRTPGFRMVSMATGVIVHGH